MRQTDVAIVRREPARVTVLNVRTGQLTDLPIASVVARVPLLLGTRLLLTWTDDGRVHSARARGCWDYSDGRSCTAMEPVPATNPVLYLGGPPVVGAAGRWQELVALRLRETASLRHVVSADTRGSTAARRALWRERAVEFGAVLFWLEGATPLDLYGFTSAWELSEMAYLPNLVVGVAESFPARAYVAERLGRALPSTLVDTWDAARTLLQTQWARLTP